MGNMVVTHKWRDVVRSSEKAGGGLHLVYCDLQFSAAYATNGDTIVQADRYKIYGSNQQRSGVDIFPDFSFIIFFNHEPITGGKIAVLDKGATVNKVKLYNADGTEATNASDQSAIVARCTFVFADWPGARMDAIGSNA